jgi:hypothetical protein
VIELSRYVLEALRKDEEFILYRGQSQDDTSRAAFASYGAPSDLSRDPASESGRDDLSDEALAKSEAWHSRILVLSPVAEYPRPQSLKRLEHAYSLREELDPAWAARPVGLARNWERIVLVLEDPGGKPLGTPSGLFSWLPGLGIHTRLTAFG